jgi:DNA-binding MarR family transcriptional regulator
MSKYQLLKDIIAQIEQYEATLSTDSELQLTGFSNYLASKNNYESDKLNAGDASLADKDARLKLQDTPNSIDNSISETLVFMYRYAKQYTKKALQHSALKTIDEFTYLATLLTFTSLPKIDLIHKSVQEKTTGMETIKRLLANKYIKQSANPNDARSQLLSLTKKGEKELYSVFGNMSMVSQVVTGNLSAIEKTQLAFLLKKLDMHHNDIFMHKKDAELQELIFNMQEN